MNAALFGLISAAGLGTADFMARFSARALGAPLTYAVVLLIGSIGATAWFLLSGVDFVWSVSGCGYAVAHGLSVASMCMLLYAGLARGPVAIVAPIVAAHPALVLVVNVMMGVRPGAAQWAAMSLVIAGGIMIARSAESHPQFTGAKSSELRTTILIALAACLAYVLLVLTAQAAAPLIGEIQTILIARWSGLTFVAALLWVQRTPIAVPLQWLPFVGLQALLDGLGYAAFLAGARSEAPHIAMVVASTFSVVTVILAKFVLKEPISRLQWIAIVMIAIGTAALAGNH